MKKPLKRILLGLALLAGVTAAYQGYVLWRTVNVRIPEAYAAWDCAVLIEEYMETHDGLWPNSWDDLGKAAGSFVAKGGVLRGYTLSNLYEISERVRVDWNADPEALRRAEHVEGNIPFNVVTRLDGTAFPTVWSGKEPNTMIWRYLQETRTEGVEEGAEGKE